MKTITIPGVVIMIDINDFKNMNTLYGVNVGDKLLIRISSTINQLLNGQGILYRFLSDIFVIHFIGQDETFVLNFNKKLIEAITKPIFINENEISISISVGAYPFNIGDTIDTIIKNIEYALHKAKKLGINNISVFNRKDKEEYENSITLEDEIRACISRNFERFQLYFQPVFNSSKNMIGAEALLRFNLTDNHLIYPHSLIPCLQKCGVLEKVEKWILQNAIEKCRYWITKSGLDNFIMIINSTFAHIETFKTPINTGF